MSDHPAELLAGSSGNSLHIWRVKNITSSPCLPSTRPGSLELGVVAWNRNNKVVAGARSDGSILLSYSSGEPMSTLRPNLSDAGKDSFPPAMAWGAGSKRLAVATQDGNLQVHDMITKTASAHDLAPKAILGLHYHPSDRFLMVTTSDAAHLLDRDMRPLGRLQLDPGNITATALDTQGIGLVTGSVDGIVQLWDLKLRQQKGSWTDPTGSGFGVRAVVNCTSQPHLVYVANRSGNIWTLDERAPSNGSSSPLIRLGAPITAFSTKESAAILAAGTRDGAVYLYDPRNAHAPLTTLSTGGHAAISSLNWQHCFINSTAPNAISSTGIAAARTTEEQPSLSTHQVAIRGSTAGTVAPRRPPNSAVTDRTAQATASALLLERPLDLSVTPLPRPPDGSSSATQGPSSMAARRLPEPASFSFSSSSERLSASAAALEDIRRRLPLVAGGGQSMNARRDVAAAREASQFGRSRSVNPESSVGVSQQQPSLPQQDRLCPSSEQPASSPLRPRHIQDSVDCGALSPNRLNGSALSSPSKLTHPASFLSSPKPRVARGATQVQLGSTWRIPAGYQGREPGTERNTNQLPPTIARDGPTQSPKNAQEPHSSSPVSTCSVDSVGPRTRTADEDDGTVLGGKKEQTGMVGISRDDLLALHLDMLNQFEAQRDHMTSLVKDLVVKNDSLAAELADLRSQFHELLVRRKDVDWL